MADPLARYRRARPTLAAENFARKACSSTEPPGADIGGPFGFVESCRNFGRFSTHLAWVSEHGTNALIQKALASDVGFAKDSTLGPWGGSLRVDAGLVDSLRTSDETAYARLVQASYRVMFDCDSAPGPKPEELMQIVRPACIVPGADESHARSAAHFVTECLPDSRFLDLPTDAQDSESVFTFFDDFYGA